MGTKYLGVTYDRTKAMDIPEEQFKLCKEANGQFCPLLTPLQPLTNPPSCIAALYTKNSKEIDRLCVNNQSTTRTLPTNPTRTQRVGHHLIIIQATTTSNCHLPHKTSHIYTHITTHTHFKTRTRLQRDISTLSPTT